MSLLDILAIAVGLAMDAFTVAMAVGLHLSKNDRIGPRQYFRLGFHFGLFQFLMPIIGWLAGSTVADYIHQYAHWAALILLSYIGIKLIVDSRGEESYSLKDPTRGYSLVVLSTATSIDALATGLSLAFLGTGIIYPSIYIGIVAGLFTLVGLYIGGRIGLRWRSRLAWLGGLILIGIGLKIVIERYLL